MERNGEWLSCHFFLLFVIVAVVINLNKKARLDTSRKRKNRLNNNKKNELNIEKELKKSIRIPDRKSLHIIYSKTERDAP
jgi:hypothetical protein